MESALKKAQLDLEVAQRKKKLVEVEEQVVSLDQSIKDIQNEIENFKQDYVALSLTKHLAEFVQINEKYAEVFENLLKVKQPGHILSRAKKSASDREKRSAEAIEFITSLIKYERMDN